MRRVEKDIFDTTHLFDLQIVIMKSVEFGFALKFAEIV
jgi:hypothetical protein